MEHPVVPGALHLKKLADILNFQRMEWIFGVRFLPGATYTFFRDILKYDSVKAVEAELVLSNIASIEADILAQPAVPAQRHCRISGARMMVSALKRFIYRGGPRL